MATVDSAVVTSADAVVAAVEAAVAAFVGPVHRNRENTVVAAL